MKNLTPATTFRQVAPALGTADAHTADQEQDFGLTPFLWSMLHPLHWRGWSTDAPAGGAVQEMSMHSNDVHQAIILAAGLGSRLRGETQPLPKPLVRCGGIPLLKRTLLTASREGITRFVLVVGCEGDLVKAVIAPDPDLAHLELVWVENPDYRLSNGVSVLKAKPFIEGEFFLMMSDHIVDQSVYRTLQNEPARGGLVLAVDSKITTIFDMDDATKVKRGPQNTIADIGKEIPDFDCIDTGVFRCDPVLFDHLEAVLEATGDTSLSHGVNALKATGLARVADVGDAWWQDVDTPETQVYGEALLVGMLGRADDGPVSRWLNRRISRPITRALMNTRINPNTVTALSLLVGLLAAASVATGALWAFVVGGLLYQFSSILRGVDGELARLRMQESERGAWFNTLADDVTNLSFQGAVGFGVAQATGEPLWFVLSLATVGTGSLLAGYLYRALRALGLGSHRALNWQFRNPSEDTFFQRFCARFAFLAGRDVYAAVMAVLSLMGVMGLQFGLVLGALIVAAVGGQFITTEVKLATRREKPVSAKG